MRKKLALICLSFLILFLATNIGKPLIAKEKQQVIMLFVEGMSFHDLEQLKKLSTVDKWLDGAGAGALSIRTPGSLTAANGYLLMGSGGQALYSEKSGTGYHPYEALSFRETAGERAQELGSDQAQEVARSSIIFPGIFRLLADNREKPYSAQIGLLGTVLAENNIQVALYGNGDYEDTRQRHAVLFAMDQQGRVPTGDISAKSMELIHGYPYGIKTNYTYLLEKIHSESQAGLIIAQLSDLSRLYQLSADMDTGQFTRQYERVLRDLSFFLDRLLVERKAHQRIVLASPAVNHVAKKEKALLTPVLVWGEKVSGVLTSATTRQSGLVSGLDMVPTVLSWLDVPVPKGLAGHVIRIEKGNGLTALQNQVGEIHHTYATRPAVLYTYVMLQIVIVGCAVVLWWFGRKGEGAGLLRLRKGIRLALLALLWFPALLLAESLLDWQVSGAVVLGGLIMTALIAAFWQEAYALPRVVMTVSGVTTAILLVDGWTGAHLMRQSYLGYDPVIGARFYGLGNEYEGVLIGSTIMLVASLYEGMRGGQKELSRENKWLPAVSVAIYSVVLYYMVAPNLGTDAGGFLAGLIGFSVALSRLEGWRIGKKGLLVLAGGLVMGVCGLMAISLMSDQPLTHVGRLSQQIVHGEWSEVGQMIERKLAMNLRLIRVSIWSKAFVVSLIALGVLTLKNDRFLHHLTKDTPYLVKGFAGVIVGALAGLILNDSGIVTAATCITFLVVTALYAALEEPAQERCST
ncbi:hypothetical protein BP422_28095 [Brevibacillus formosus]|uniref:Alkaline phosphatase n=1 Tax=Brevibacillus formosus TaxID=54913 RepID=A0A220MQ41_9BACL|nr:hypothetical protein [Brevibacillus formosus]ASJ57043.1 hypothetical protein BP422_28095 [Brevibacillus formosus]